MPLSPAVSRKDAVSAVRLSVRPIRTHRQKLQNLKAISHFSRVTENPIFRQKCEGQGHRIPLNFRIGDVTTESRDDYNGF